MKICLGSQVSCGPSRFNMTKDSFVGTEYIIQSNDSYRNWFKLESCNSNFIIWWGDENFN